MTRAFLSFIVISGVYFWLGPIGIIFLLRWLIVKKNIYYTVLSLSCVAACSWIFTASLTYCVWRMVPDMLPDQVIKTAFWFGYCYCFVTAAPSVILYCTTAAVVRHPRARVVVGCIAASMPYILLLCLFLFGNISYLK